MTYIHRYSILLSLFVSLSVCVCVFMCVWRKRKFCRRELCNDLLAYTLYANHACIHLTYNSDVCVNHSYIYDHILVM